MRRQSRSKSRAFLNWGLSWRRLDKLLVSLTNRLYLECFCLKHQVEFPLEHQTLPNTQFICSIIQFYFPNNLLFFNFVTEKCRICSTGEGKFCFCWNVVFCDLFLIFELSLYFLTYGQEQSSAISLTSFGIFKETDFRFFI